ncbi:hypothetical protein C1645_700983, partial [Glomus cerebriforme]
LYIWEFIIINSNMHLHLKYCILDYGPFHSFWCYVYERNIMSLFLNFNLYLDLIYIIFYYFVVEF